MRLWPGTEMRAPLFEPAAPSQFCFFYSEPRFRRALCGGCTSCAGPAGRPEQRPSSVSLTLGQSVRRGENATSGAANEQSWKDGESQRSPVVQFATFCCLFFTFRSSLAYS